MNARTPASAPSAVEAIAVAHPELRPLMRGTLHLVMAALTPFGLVLLLLIADSPRAYVGASIFAATLVLLYGTSATYHMVPMRLSWKRIVKRIDHAMIFALIAGTYTPFCLIVLGNAWGITMLTLVWSFAGIGMLLKTVWIGAPRWLSVGMYLGLGWLGVIPVVEVVRNMHAGAIATLLAGGLLYTIGAIVYAVKRPNPFPRVFGFHEVFHALVVAGSVVHFALIAVYVLPSEA
jgi:hemolysin III